MENAGRAEPQVDRRRFLEDENMKAKSAYPTMGEWLNRLEKSVAETQEEFHALASRLRPVSEPQRTESGDNETLGRVSPDREPISEYNTRLIRVEQQISSLRGYITDTISKLQV